MQLKAILSAILAVALSTTMLTSCTKNDNSTPSQTDSSSATSAATESPEPVQEEIRDIKSIDLIKEMKIGWNLGNTLEATGGNGLDTEISWGNPRTTKAMIDHVRETGINVLRLPVTWYKHFTDEVEHTIDPVWMARVKEVVDYAYSEGMFVIINLHHENWHFPSEDNKEMAKSTLKDVWTQIAEEFKNYDEHLIFEGMNEPRMVNTEYEWNGGTEESRAIINEFNAVFMETVRNSGGNNGKRHLMIPGYAASSGENVLDDLVIPDDDKVIISVHAYLPYNFALNTKGTNRFETDKNASTSDIKKVFTMLKERFIDKDIAVVIGECGAMVKDKNIEALERFAKYFMGVAAWAEVPCVIFDNGSFISGETFGMLNRQACEWEYPTVIDSYMEGLNNPIILDENNDAA